MRDLGSASGYIELAWHVTGDGITWVRVRDVGGESYAEDAYALARLGGEADVPF